MRNIFVSRAQNLCPKQMLRARENGETFVSATMCPQQCVLVCQYLNIRIGHIRIPGIGLELACKWGWCGGSLFKRKLHLTLLNDIPPLKPPLHASSSPIPGILYDVPAVTLVICVTKNQLTWHNVESMFLSIFLLKEIISPLVVFMTDKTPCLKSTLWAYATTCKTHQSRSDPSYYSKKQLKGATCTSVSRYFDLFWASTKLPLNWRKPENNTLER